MATDQTVIIMSYYGSQQTDDAAQIMERTSQINDKSESLTVKVRG